MSLTQIIKIIGKNIVLYNSFVLSCIKSIFGMEVRWDNWPHTSFLWKLGSYGNQIETSVTLCLKSYGFIFGMELPWKNRNQPHTS